MKLLWQHIKCFYERRTFVASVFFSFPVFSFLSVKKFVNKKNVSEIWLRKNFRGVSPKWDWHVKQKSERMMRVQRWRSVWSVETMRRCVWQMDIRSIGWLAGWSGWWGLVRSALIQHVGLMMEKASLQYTAQSTGITLEMNPFKQTSYF